MSPISPGDSRVFDHRRRRELFIVRVHVIVLTAICLSWSSLEADDYNYPYHDPYVATVTTAILNGEGDTPRLKRQVVKPR